LLFLDEFEDPNYEDPKSGETDDESYHPSRNEDLAGLYYKQLTRNKKITEIGSFFVTFLMFLFINIHTYISLNLSRFII
jgi:hypothetical protein